MKRVFGNIVGILILALPSVRWVLNIIGLASIPEDLAAWGIVVKTMLDDPWITVPAFLGVAIIAFTNIPALRFWEKTARSDISVEPPNRISITDFLREAEKMGWRIVEPVSHIRELADQLKQATADGTLIVWGRQVDDNIINTAKNKPLRPIPKEHWYEFEIYWLSAVEIDIKTTQIVSICEDNSQTQSSRLFPPEVGFVDLHLDLEPAISWLNNQNIKPKLIQLSEATRILYEETRGHDFSFLAEQMTDDSDDVLTFCAHALLTGEDGIALYGCKPPSTKLELIPRDHVNSWHFSESCNDLVLVGDKKPEFTDLHVLKDELDAKINDKKDMEL